MFKPALLALLPLMLGTTAFAQSKIEVAFVLDTTGSMADLIEGAKEKIWSITNAMVDLNPEAEISFALIGYRDIGDDYVIQTHEMTQDVQGIYADLRRFVADGGGDTPEAVNEALHEGIVKLAWGKGQGDRRILFLVGDAPPHMDYANGPKFDKTLIKAREKGIIVNTIQAGDDPETQEYWRKIAELGKGRYIAIPQDGGQLQHIPTPMDAQILEVQLKIDATILPYGTAAEVSDLNAKLEDRKAASVEVQADNASFYAKKGGKKEAVTGGNDLVSDLANGDLSYDKIEKPLLPAPLQALPAPELEAHVTGLIAQRETLEAEMSKLVQERDAYIASQAVKPESGDSFDTSLKEILKEQLAVK